MDEDALCATANPDADVRFGSKADMMSALCQKRTSGNCPCLFNYFVGKLLELLRHFEAECLGGRQIDDELVFCRRLHWEVDRLLTLKNAVGVCRGSSKLISHLP